MLAIVLFFTWSTASSQSGLYISWDNQVGCSSFSIKPNPNRPILLEDIIDGKCIDVCENSMVKYTFSGELLNNPIITWGVVGGTITNSDDNNCEVNWGSVGSGNLFLTVTIPVKNGPSIVISKNICLHIIDIPIADFNYIPNPKNRGFACIGQNISFINTSTTNSGTAIVKYFWEFGDGTYSTAFEPSHSYTHEGIYTITLTVYNSCGCSNTFTRSIRITRDKGFNIICPGVVCEGQTVTYSLPFEGQNICEGGYNWSAIGSTTPIVVNPNNGDATVIWNNVNDSGFGYLTFTPTNCDLPCLAPTTIKVPVIKSIGTITGNTTICTGQQSFFELPQWPSTDFTWEIQNNTNNSIADIIAFDQRNRVIITPHMVGTFVLQATYINTLLHCGGKASFEFTVTQSTTLDGPITICQNTSATYVASNTTNWTLQNNMGTILATQEEGTEFNYTFTTAGTYILSIGVANSACGTIQKTITVLPVQTKPILHAVTVKSPDTGANVLATIFKVCPNIPYKYSIVNNNPAVQYHWSVTNGSITGVAIGNQVVITFTGAAPAEIKIVKESIGSLPCGSIEPLIIPILIKNIDAVISGSLSVCPNSYATYTAIKSGVTPETPYTEGENYEWSFVNGGEAYGSIVTGQATKEIQILWNNVTSPTTVQLKLKITLCSLKQEYIKTISIQPTLPITITTTSNTSICSGEAITLTAISAAPGINLNPNAPITWDYGSGPVTLTNYDNNFTTSFSNITANGSDVGHTVTATITNPNTCVGVSTASIYLSVKPGPTASASIASGGNAFCTKFEINTLIGSATSGSVYSWQNTNNPTTSLGNGNQLQLTPNNGFSSYYFTAINSEGCKTESNRILIQKLNCTVANCTPAPILTNNSEYISCSTISLVGSASNTPSPPLSTYWDSIPFIAGIGNSSTVTVPNAGIYNVIFYATYLCGGEVNTYYLPKSIVVPYIPNFSYKVKCASTGNSYQIEVFNNTDFYTLVPLSSRTFQYDYSTNNGATWNPAISTPDGSITTASGLAPGTYLIRLTVTGNYNGQPQLPCSVTNTVTITAPPAYSIGITNSSTTFNTNTRYAQCYDTPIMFDVINSSTGVPITQAGETFKWTFEGGNPPVTNLLQNPQRVFPISGFYNVKLDITDRYGCSLTPLSVLVITPQKCFSGKVGASPSIVCQGESVSITYDPATIDCSVTPFNTSYIWMNGQNPVPGAPSTKTLTVTDEGIYWVKVFNDKGCKYETNSRVAPGFIPSPSVTINGDTAYCGNDAPLFSVTTDPGNTSFEWSLIDNGTLIPQPNYQDLGAISFSNLAPGNYVVQVSVTSPNGCTTIKDKGFSVAPLPSAPVLSQEVVCAGQNPNMPYYYSVIMASTDNTVVNLNWSNGTSNTSFITVTDGGAYTAWVTNAEGCKNSAQITVPKSPENFLWVAQAGCQSFCSAESSLDQLIGPNYTVDYWAWLMDGSIVAQGNNSLTDPYTLLSSGTYALTTQIGNCSETSAPFNYVKNNKCDFCEIAIESLEVKRSDVAYCSYDVILKITSGVAGSATLVAPQNNAVISPTAFTISGGSTNYPITVVPVGTNNGFIQLFLTVLYNGKTCVTNYNLVVPNCSPSEGKKANTKQAIILSPNPANTEATLSYAAIEENSTVTVYDLLGRTMAAFPISDTTGSLILPTANYPTGVYVVVLSDKNGVYAQLKLMINN